MEETLSRLTERADVARAVLYIRDRDEDTLARQIELSEIPAPPFGETQRAVRLAELLADSGLEDVQQDVEGNVVAARPGEEALKPVIVSAHLDTVFPAGTDVRVTRHGDELHGPGISDDARGLAAMLTLCAALDEGELRTRRPLHFVGTVGEEGPGDLRGVKHLFGATGVGREAHAFISLDGAGLERIVLTGLGSRRFRITVRGPGGHSWSDWGTPNPIHALTDITSQLTATHLSQDPRATLTVARWGGGKSINAIPQEAWIEVDTRCEDEATLASLESTLRSLVKEATSGSAELVSAIAEIGARPAGSTDPKAPLVRAAHAATRHQGRTPIPTASSTDSNIAMSMEIPAITIGCGGEAGKAHTTDEWYRNVGGPEGIIRALHIVLLTAELVA
jgi:tripeptide aminopeptidase